MIKKNLFYVAILLSVLNIYQAIVIVKGIDIISVSILLSFFRLWFYSRLTLGRDFMTILIAIYIEVGLILILLPFFQGLILLIGSMLVQLPLFDELKIIVMIGSFSLVNLAMIFLIAFVGIKAVTYVGGVSGSVKAAMKYIGV